MWAHLARYVLPEVIANTLTLVVGVALLGGRARHDARMADRDVRISGPALLRLGVAAAAGDSGLRAGVRRGRISRLRRSAAVVAARVPSATSRWFPPIRSTGGVIVVLSLALYPYVYLLARSAFLTQGRRALEAAQTLGVGGTTAAWRVALPMARPWIAAGIALVCMETLADFGAVSVFNYNTFTTAIYRAWFGMFSVSAALELVGRADVVRVARVRARATLACGGAFLERARRQIAMRHECSCAGCAVGWRSRLSPRSSCWRSCCRCRSC